MATTHIVELSNAVEQNDKGQDQPFSGITASGKYYSGVFDGHGKNNVINALREYQATGELSEFMDNESPVEAIQQRLNDDKVCTSYISSGSTISFGILDGNLLKIINCGDSQTFVFRNGILEFITEEHFCGNSREKERLGELGKYKKSSSLKAISETTLIQVPSEYRILDNFYELAVTQALGHNDFAKPAPDVHEMVINLNDEVIVVSVTDGVTDMLICDGIMRLSVPHDTAGLSSAQVLLKAGELDQDKIREEDIRMIYELNAEELKNKIQERWGQEWIMRPLNQKEQKARYEKHHFDDIGIARMIIRPLIL
jgi:serine/threonine protein phosphatase PrpC